jgi:hypothetical protein
MVDTPGPWGCAGEGVVAADEIVIEPVLTALEA